MSAEIKHLYRGLPKEGDPVAPVDSVISLLEDVLNGAKTGEVRGVAVAAVLTNGRTASMYASAKEPLAPHMVSAITVLQHTYVQEIVDNASEDGPL